MSVKIYAYKNCGTCVKALQYLDGKKIAYQKISIVDQPPTLAELRLMVKYLEADGGSFKNLFNTSGVIYRELKISDKLKAGMTQSEALNLLAQNGKLVKRPFVLTNQAGVVGFKQDQWAALF